MPSSPTSHFDTYIPTPTNGFGLFRSYLTIPTRDPEADLGLDDFCDASTFAVARPAPQPWWACFGRSSVTQVSDKFFAPFLNATTFRLMAWFYSGSSMKSLGELDRLVQDVLCAEDFSVDELRQFSATREARRVDEWEDVVTSEGPFRMNDGWHETTVRLRIPCEDVSRACVEEQTPEFEVPGVFHRSLVDIIRTTFQSPSALTYHLIPFKLYAHPPAPPQSSSTTTASEPTESSTPDEPPERVYSELYNSDAMIEEYERINARFAKAPTCAPDTPHTTTACPTASFEPPTPTIENVIAAMMLWSDSTHLASFGSASLWPAYLYFGNQSKYSRGKPSEFAAHHIAYLPSVSTDPYRINKL